MGIRKPHFLLFSEARRRSAEAASGEWRFVLEEIEGTVRLEVEESEPVVRGDRLDLLAIVRGLEALDQPSRVTLVTNSPYVARGFRHGLPEWRENDWQWERFGQMAPVRNGDLWRRIDRALQYHHVDCRTLGAPRHRSNRPSPPRRSADAIPRGRPSPDTPSSPIRAGWWGRLRKAATLAWRTDRSAATFSQTSHAGC